MGAALRAGLLGLGMMGRHHARALRSLDGVELVAVADPAGDVHRAASGLGIGKDVEHLVRAGVDLTVVAVPTAFHLDAALCPHLYLHGDPSAELVRVARGINSNTPRRVVRRLVKALGPLAGRRVVILGATYRTGVKETAFSGVFATVEALAQEGGLPLVHDPFFSPEEIARLGLTPFELGERADAAILHTDHAVYSDLTEAELPGVQILMDGRPAMTDWVGHEVQVITLGRG